MKGARKSEVNSYQDIQRRNLDTGTEALFVSDDHDHVQWFRLADVDGFGTDEPMIPYMAKCDTCDDRHRWRRVRVIV
jgi:hypothetical protein